MRKKKMKGTVRVCLFMPPQERMHVSNLIKSMKWINKAYLILKSEASLVYPERTAD